MTFPGLIKSLFKFSKILLWKSAQCGQVSDEKTFTVTMLLEVLEVFLLSNG
jgi:hypothetical protein